MSEQKTEGSGRDIGRDGAGSSMGKAMPSSTGGGSTSIGTGSTSSGTGTSSTGTIGSSTSSTIGNVAEPLAGHLAASLHEGADKASSLLHEAADRVDEKSQQLGDAYQQFVVSGRNYVRTKPATALLAAATLGFALSWLLKGRR